MNIQKRKRDEGRLERLPFLSLRHGRNEYDFTYDLIALFVKAGLWVLLVLTILDNIERLFFR